MNVRLVIAASICAAFAADATAGSKLIASSSNAKRLDAKVVIRNDASHIRAFRFDGNIARALFALRSTRQRLQYQPFGEVVFGSSASFSRQRVPSSLAPVFREAAEKYGVDPRLVVAVARRESAFDDRAVSPVGARGVMQLMPSTAEYLGVADSFDARANVFAGTRYLRQLLDTFRGDLDLTLAAYNAGPGAVQKYRGVPPYRETQQYVRAIRAEYEAAIR